ncbi:MAG: SOS response-associated peptidase [Rhodospirillaceae bacterium]
MCGRASQHADICEIERQFGPLVPRPAPNHPARYNAAPRQTLIVVRQDLQAGGRVVEPMRWGLIPSWAKDTKLADRAINARDVGDDGTGLETKPMFRGAWRAGRRCLVPLNSFFEWKSVGKSKHPFAIALGDGSLMGVAGLWETWCDPTSREMICSFTIITTAANEVLAPIHHRMPVIIAPEDFEAWLVGDTAAATRLLQPCPGAALQLWPVTRRINRVGELDGPECIAPLEGSPASPVPH